MKKIWDQNLKDIKLKNIEEGEECSVTPPIFCQGENICEKKSEIKDKSECSEYLEILEYSSKMIGRKTNWERKIYNIYQIITPNGTMYFKTI